MFENAIRFVGDNYAVEFFGIRLVGVNAENGKKLLMTLAFIALLFGLRYLANLAARLLLRHEQSERLEFWVRQGLHLATAALLILGIASIWFDDPARLATGLGLVSAGLAFALQKVVTAIAGYFIILRGKVFNVGDRIRMGGVRGDVIALGFTQTTIMEMGQPPSVQADEPAMWVSSRQFTGRVVTVSNAKIFDEPVYNYSQDFPYLWEEIKLPVPYTADRDRAEQILLEVARRHTLKLAELGAKVLEQMRKQYFLTPADTSPQVYYRMTDNWLELTVRFLVEDRGIREVKDRIYRDLLGELDAAGIGLASTTFEITALPELRLRASPELRAALQNAPPERPTQPR